MHLALWWLLGVWYPWTLVGAVLYFAYWRRWYRLGLLLLFWCLWQIGVERPIPLPRASVGEVVKLEAKHLWWRLDQQLVVSPLIPDVIVGDWVELQYQVSALSNSPLHQSWRRQGVHYRLQIHHHRFLRHRSEWHRWLSHQLRKITHPQWKSWVLSTLYHFRSPVIPGLTWYLVSFSFYGILASVRRRAWVVSLVLWGWHLWTFGDSFWSWYFLEELVVRNLGDRRIRIVGYIVFFAFWGRQYLWTWSFLLVLLAKVSKLFRFPNHHWVMKIIIIYLQQGIAWFDLVAMNIGRFLSMLNYVVVLSTVLLGWTQMPWLLTLISHYRNWHQSFFWEHPLPLIVVCLVVVMLFAKWQKMIILALVLVTPYCEPSHRVIVIPYRGELVVVVQNYFHWQNVIWYPPHVDRTWIQNIRRRYRISQENPREYQGLWTHIRAYPEMIVINHHGRHYGVVRQRGYLPMGERFHYVVTFRFDHRFLQEVSSYRYHFVTKQPLVIEDFAVIGGSNASFSNHQPTSR